MQGAFTVSFVSLQTKPILKRIDLPRLLHDLTAVLPHITLQLKDLVIGEALRMVNDAVRHYSLRNVISPDKRHSGIPPAFLIDNSRHQHIYRIHSIPPTELLLH